MTVIKNRGHQHIEALLEAFNQGTGAVLDLFNQDATVSYPYAASLGMPSDFSMEEYRKHLDLVLGRMAGISFSELQVYKVEGKESYWAEVHGETSVPDATGLYRQDYVIYFSMENGKFSEYKEYWNILPVLKSLLGSEETQRIINND